MDHPGALAWAQMNSGQAHLLEGNLGEVQGCLNLALEAGRRMVAPFLMLESLEGLVELQTIRRGLGAESQRMECDLERLRVWPHRSEAFYHKTAGLLERLRVGVN